MVDPYRDHPPETIQIFGDYQVGLVKNDDFPWIKSRVNV